MSKDKVKNLRNKDFWARNEKTNGYLLRRTLFDFGYKFVRAVIMFGLCFLIVQPLINKVSLSFMKTEDLYDASVVNIPRHFTTTIYRHTMSIINFKKGLFFSVLFSLIVAILQVFSATLVGYGFARFKFPFKKLLFGCVILLIIIPPQVIMSPLFIFFNNFDIFGIVKALNHGKPLNLTNSFWPYLMMCITCMGYRSGLYIFMLRQYFRGIPKELEEAAYVDGCGNFMTFIRIMLPDAKAMITSCFLFAFVWQWTDSFYSKLFLGKVTLLPKELGSIQGRLDQYLVSNGLGTKASAAMLNQYIATGSLLTILPLLIIYLFAQKGFVESLSQTGIKM